MLFFPFIGLVSVLTLWSSFASVPFTAINPRESIGRRLTSSLKVSLMTVGTYEVTRKAAYQATVTIKSYRPVRSIQDQKPTFLPGSFDEWLSITPLVNTTEYKRRGLPLPMMLNGRPFPWQFFRYYGDYCRRGAAPPSPGPTSKPAAADSFPTVNYKDLLSLSGYLGLILASLALGRCLGAYLLVDPASLMEDGETSLLLARASPALPPRVVTGLCLELRKELVNGLPLMWNPHFRISSIPVYQTTEAANLHLLKPQPVYTTGRQNRTQTQALVLRRLENISPFVLIQIAQLLVAALESGTISSQELIPEPKLDLAAPQGEPKKKRNRPGQKQRRRQWTRDMLALQDKVIREAEGTVQSQDCCPT